MKALFGTVALLVALAIGGLIAVKQLKAVGPVGAAARASAGPMAAPQTPGSGPLLQQARQLPNQVADDVAKAMSQGAAARREEVDKP